MIKKWVAIVDDQIRFLEYTANVPRELTREEKKRMSKLKMITFVLVFALSFFFALGTNYASIHDLTHAWGTVIFSEILCGCLWWFCKYKFIGAILAIYLFAPVVTLLQYILLIIVSIIDAVF